MLQGFRKKQKPVCHHFKSHNTVASACEYWNRICHTSFCCIPLFITNKYFIYQCNVKQL